MYGRVINLYGKINDKITGSATSATSEYNRGEAFTTGFKDLEFIGTVTYSKDMLIDNFEEANRFGGL
jgi:hypothetical protein